MGDMGNFEPSSRGTTDGMWVVATAIEGQGHIAFKSDDG